MVRRTRLWTWLTRATGTVAAWSLATAWAHAQPPLGANDDGEAAPAARSTPPPPPPAPARAADSGAVSVDPESEPRPRQDLSNTWGYSRTGSPRPRYVRNTQDPIAFAANPVGFYSGVSVRGNQVPPHPAPNDSSKPTLTWAGFERTPTGSRVFFQLSTEAEYTVKQQGGVITVRMRRTKVNVRNNLRRLDLSYFKTPVQTVKVRRRGRDAVATIRLKSEATPDVSYVDSSGSGYKLLVLSFTHASTAASVPNEAPRRTQP